MTFCGLVQNVWNHKVYCVTRFTVKIYLCAQLPFFLKSYHILFTTGHSVLTQVAQHLQHPTGIQRTWVQFTTQSLMFCFVIEVASDVRFLSPGMYQRTIQTFFNAFRLFEVCSANKAL